MRPIPFPCRLRPTPHLSRFFATSPKTPLEILSKCPPSTCACAPLPDLPPTYPIDHTRPLANTTPPYKTHILIPTGQNNWPSRIEDSPATNLWGPLTAKLKSELGPRGGSYDPEHPVLITASSFSPEPKTTTSRDSGSAGSTPTPVLLFPSTTTPLPRKLHTLLTSSNSSILPISSPTILICSHSSRDIRCGTLGPVLYAEFVKQLSSAGLEANTSFPSQEATRSSTSGPSTVNVACISHIGGHAWAGNVIIYNGGGALKKTGIWYGRVEPRHVEYIIRETVLEGRVLGELFRGGVGV